MRDDDKDERNPADVLQMLLMLNEKDDKDEHQTPAQALLDILAFIGDKVIGCIELLALSDALEYHLAQQECRELGILENALKLFREGKTKEVFNLLSGKRYLSYEMIRSREKTGEGYDYFKQKRMLGEISTLLVQRDIKRSTVLLPGYSQAYEKAYGLLLEFWYSLNIASSRYSLNVSQIRSKLRLASSSGISTWYIIKGVIETLFKYAQEGQPILEQLPTKDQETLLAAQEQAFINDDADEETQAS